MHLPARLGVPPLQLQQTRLKRAVRSAQEPLKADLLAFAKDGTVPPRQAFCILQAPPSTLAIEAVVDLSSGPKAGVSSWKTARSLCRAVTRPHAPYGACCLHSLVPTVSAWY